MKSLISLFSCLLIGAAPAWSAQDIDSSAQVTLTYGDPAAFPDAPRGALIELKPWIERLASELLPAGQRLAITVTSVDLAGEFEPLRRPPYSAVRIMRDVYPPRVELQFRLTDASGAVIAEGRRRLENVAFHDTATVRSTDPLRYDKALWNAWLRTEFAAGRS
jgi:hypothetical protein